MLTIFQKTKLLQRFSALPAAVSTDSVKSHVTRQFNTSSPLLWKDDYLEYKAAKRANDNGRNVVPEKRFQANYDNRNSYSKESSAGGGSYKERGRGGHNGGSRHSERSNREPSKREYSEGNDDKRKNIRGNDNIDVFSSSGFGRQADKAIKGDGFWYPESVNTHEMSFQERKIADWSVPTEANPQLERQLFGDCKEPTNTLQPPTDIVIKSTTGQEHTPVTTFAEMDLGEIINRNLALMKLPAPTPIQSYAMPAIMQGHNLIASAQTGSGKTAAFLTPTIARMCQQGPGDLYKNDTSRDVLPLVLVLAPTRELCTQIFYEAQKLTYRSQIRPYACYGGTNISTNIAELRKGTELLVATPGRLKDLVDRGVVSLRCIQTLILDEADFMLDLGFSKIVNEICFDMGMSKEKKTLLFSATFPADIMGLARSIMAGGDQSTVKIAIGRCGSTSDSIEQKFMAMNGGHLKKGKLLDLMQTIEKGSKTLIFVGTKVQCRDLAEELNYQGYSSAAINGDLSQSQRERALKNFKSGQTEILVATEVAARGIDVPCINTVINYDMPNTLDQYVHRIGRTGRVGMKGTAISFLDQRKDQHLINGLKALMSETKQKTPDFMNRR